MAEVGDRNTDLADFSVRQYVVGVVSGLRGQVECNGETGLALGQVGAVELVRSRGGGMARIGAH